MGLMNQEIAKRLLELSETGLEGLEYIHENNLEGKFEQTLTVFTDVVRAFSEVEQVLDHSGFLANCGELGSATQLLEDGLDWMAKSYDKKDNLRPVEVMQLTLMPRYKAWKEELNQCLSEYRVSK